MSAWKFDFGDGWVAPGYRPVRSTTIFNPETGFGLDLQSKVTGEAAGETDPLRGDGWTSEQPFFFSVAVPEGNYRVTVILGSSSSATTNTIKAESRRLMVEQAITAPGEFATRTFTVNVRTPRIAADSSVRLKAREKDCLHWDDKLTLEFNGARPGVVAVEVARAEDAVTVYLLGDSTVTDQPREPWNSWGQMLPRFFGPEIAVANHAESGESIKSSLGARRFEKVLSTIRAGDYFFLQFGHNDMKDRAADALAAYRANLVRLIGEARRREAIPVLVTSMERKAGAGKQTLGDYPQTVRDVARELNVPLIDLHAMSKMLYQALGPARIDRAFQDGTHHNNYGSYELARCVVEGIRANHLDLARHLAEDVAPFDPAHPDDPDAFAVPASPMASERQPDGN